MNSDAGFVKRIPVEIQDVRFKSRNDLSDPSRRTDDIMRKQLGDPYPTAEGKPYGVGDEHTPGARGTNGINTDLKPADTGQIPGGAE